MYKELVVQLLPDIKKIFEQSSQYKPGKKHTALSQNTNSR